MTSGKTWIYVLSTVRCCTQSLHHRRSRDRGAISYWVNHYTCPTTPWRSWSSSTTNAIKNRQYGTANAFVNQSLRQKKSKSWDMKFHWLWDKLQESNLRVFWDWGSQNGFNYFDKPYPTPYHKLMRSKYILALHNIFQHNISLYNVAHVRVYWNVPMVHYYTRTTLMARLKMTSETSNTEDFSSNNSIIN